MFQKTWHSRRIPNGGEKNKKSEGGETQDGVPDQALLHIGKKHNTTGGERKWGVGNKERNGSEGRLKDEKKPVLKHREAQK